MTAPILATPVIPGLGTIQAVPNVVGRLVAEEATVAQRPVVDLANPSKALQAIAGLGATATAAMGPKLAIAADLETSLVSQGLTSSQIYAGGIAVLLSAANAVLLNQMFSKKIADFSKLADLLVYGASFASYLVTSDDLFLYPGVVYFCFQALKTVTLAGLAMSEQNNRGQVITQSALSRD